MNLSSVLSYLPSFPLVFYNNMPSSLFAVVHSPLAPVMDNLDLSVKKKTKQETHE